MSVTVAPATALLTADEFVRQFAHKRAELVRGEVVELPMPSTRHGNVCWRVAKYLGNFVDDHDLGHVMTNDSFFPTTQTPDTVRGPDVSFYSYDRLPKGKIPEGLLRVVPELAFEVRSPSNRWASLVAKGLEYLEAGVKVVVLLDPDTETASVYRMDEIQQILHNGDELTLPDVLPGFSVPVRRFFE